MTRHASDIEKRHQRDLAASFARSRRAGCLFGDGWKVHLVSLSKMFMMTWLVFESCNVSSDTAFNEAVSHIFQPMRMANASHVSQSRRFGFSAFILISPVLLCGMRHWLSGCASVVLAAVQFSFVCRESPSFAARCRLDKAVVQALVLVL